MPTPVTITISTDILDDATPADAVTPLGVCQAELTRQVDRLRLNGQSGFVTVEHFASGTKLAVQIDDSGGARDVRCGDKDDEDDKE